MKTEEQFWSQVERTEGCWLWTASQLWNGYGQLRWQTKQRTAHRVAYELLVGPIPEGLQLDHLCSVRHCVNPAHLEAVTQQENIRRSASNWNHSTTCKRGHDITDPANIYVIPSNGKRQCRECMRFNQREKTRRKRLVSPYPAVRARLEA